jgi:hypothetical protein
LDPGSIVLETNFVKIGQMAHPNFKVDNNTVHPSLPDGEHKDIHYEYSYFTAHFRSPYDFQTRFLESIPSIPLSSYHSGDEIAGWCSGIRAALDSGYI